MLECKEYAMVGGVNAKHMGKHGASITIPQRKTEHMPLNTFIFSISDNLVDTSKTPRSLTKDPILQPQYVGRG